MNGDVVQFLLYIVCFAGGFASAAVALMIVGVVTSKKKPPTELSTQMRSKNENRI